jgi:hypothetical protein
MFGSSCEMASVKNQVEIQNPPRRPAILIPDERQQTSTRPVCLWHSGVVTFLSRDGIVATVTALRTFFWADRSSIARVAQTPQTRFTVLQLPHFLTGFQLAEEEHVTIWHILSSRCFRRGKVDKTPMACRPNIG